MPGQAARPIQRHRAYRAPRSRPAPVAGQLWRPKRLQRTALRRGQAGLAVQRRRGWRIPVNPAVRREAGHALQPLGPEIHVTDAEEAPQPIGLVAGATHRAEFTFVADRASTPAPLEYVLLPRRAARL